VTLVASDGVQEQLAAEAELKSELMSKAKELTSTVQQLSTDLETSRLEAETVTTELHQAKLTLDVSTSRL